MWECEWRKLKQAREHGEGFVKGLFEKAVEKGYRIIHIHEVWYFPETKVGLFKDYVNT